MLWWVTTTPVTAAELHGRQEIKYQIHKVLISMDQTCRGKGDLITGDFNHPVNSTTGTQSWVHQELEPAYMWNDRFTPTNTPMTLHAGIGAFAVLLEGRDYFNNTPMPGYTPYTYPHPLTTGGQPTATTPAPNTPTTRKRKKTKKRKRKRKKPARKTGE